MHLKSFSMPGGEQLLNWSPKLVSALLVVAIAYMLTQLIWRFTGAVPAPAGTTEPEVEIQTASRTESQAARYAREIASFHLFGEAAVDETAPVDAPETKLNLQLIGILAIGEKDGLAIIASSGRDEAVYKVGDQIPGNATLKAVYADRVLLESSRGLETLKLPKDEALITFEEEESGAAGEPADTGPDRINPQSLRDYRREFIRNPASLAEIAQIQPSQQDGQFVGYEVKPMRDQPLFDALGLKAGDVVTQVNGIDLNEPENGIRALRDLMKADKIEVTVLRNGQPVQLHHSLER